MCYELMNWMHRLYVDICTLSGVQISTCALCSANMMGIKWVVTLEDPLQLHNSSLLLNTKQFEFTLHNSSQLLNTEQFEFKLHAFRWALDPSYNSIATLMQCFSVLAGFVPAYCKSVTVAMTTLQHDALMRLIIYCFCQWWLKTVIVRQLLWYKYLHIMCLFHALLSRRDATHRFFPCQNKNISRLTK